MESIGSPLDRQRRLAEVFPTIYAVAGRCRQRQSDSDAFWGGRRRAPRRKQGMLIPLMVAPISMLFCSLSLADYVGLQGLSVNAKVRYLLVSVPVDSRECTNRLFSYWF